jgi:putative membrane protein
MMWDDSWSSGQWIAMALMMALFWIGAAVTVVWLVRSRGTSWRRPERDAHSAEDVLAERYARGEIDEEEFSRRRGFMAKAPHE